MVKGVSRQVVIGGAGPAGLLAGLALAREQLDCLILESMPEADWGNRICVEINSSAVLNGYVPTPDPACVLHSGEGGVDVFSPSGRIGFNVTPAPVYLVKLWRYQRQLLELAREAGCEVRFSSPLIGLRKGKDSRCLVETRFKGNRQEVACDLVVLATGLNFDLDRELYAHFGVRRRIRDSELIQARQELWRMDSRKAETATFRSPPGTLWYSVGQGGPCSIVSGWVSKDLRRASLVAGSFVRDGWESPAQLIERERREWCSGLYRRESWGEGAIPIRRPVEALAGEGVVLLGNAGAQVFPATGTGVSLFARAAAMLAGPARDYCRKGRLKEALWAYSVEYHRELGALQASSALFMQILRKFDPDCELLEGLFESGLVGSSDLVRNLEMGPTTPPPSEWVRKIPPVVARVRKFSRFLVKLPVVAALPVLYSRVYPKKPDPHAVLEFARRMDLLMRVR